MSTHTDHSRRRSNVLTRNVVITTVLALALTATEALAGGARPYIHGGRTYYHVGGVYYRPYTVGGVVYYRFVPPPIRVVTPRLLVPAGRVVVTVGRRRVVHVHAHGVFRP
jgi:hypothetical protein